MRKKVIAGNWKMNKTPSETKQILTQMKDKISTDGVDVLFCVPAISLTGAVEAVSGTDIRIGAENMFYEEQGAYTGEISALMLKDAGAEYVIIGHSERRQIFGEDNDMINKKIIKAIEHKIVPIICCGETLEQREAGETIDFVDGQIKSAYSSVSKADALNTIIAYEPIWAIGTGRVATSAQAQEVCAAIRKCLSEIYDDETAANIRVLYGGSVNASNAAELFAMPDIDGGLVGGASLKPEFCDIVEAGRNN
ncbi:MAG: triose-phosphate isomerase [Bacteroides sp.]